MHRETKATDIPSSVKAAVALRDSKNGPATCIICGDLGMPCCHVVRRSQGGMGVVENIVSLCPQCHYAFDEGLYMRRLKPLGFERQQDVRDYIIDYIKGFYPDWTPDSVTYHKWRHGPGEEEKDG